MGSSKNNSASLGTQDANGDTVLGHAEPTNAAAAPMQCENSSDTGEHAEPLDAGEPSTSSAAPAHEDQRGASTPTPQPPASREPRRSSIRPAADWHPQPRSRPSAPMVVVFSGESGLTNPSWDPDASPSRPSLTAPPPTPPREPFPLAEDLQGPEQLENTGPAQVQQPRTPTPAESRHTPLPAPPGTPEDSSLPAQSRVEHSSSQGPARTTPTDRDDPRSSRNARLWLFVVLAAAALLLVFRWSRGEGGAAGSANREQEEEALSTRSAPPPPGPPSASLPAPPAKEGATSPIPPQGAVLTSETGAVLPSQNDLTPPPTRQVTLEVKPVDAKVVYRGERYPGPPYEFVLPEGKRMAVEVARRGYRTRRVVIDGSQPKISIGLYPEPAGVRSSRRSQPD